MVIKVKAVLSTLNQIEVHGKDNLDMLLGCMMTLEHIENELRAQATKPDTEEVVENG